MTELFANFNSMDRIIKISNNIMALSHEVAADLSAIINNAVRRSHHLNIALSGGNTPRTFYSVLGTHYALSTEWKAVDFFWSDERCVPPGDRESNYRVAKEHFFERIKIQAGKIHRIRGEDDPQTEAIRYSELIKKKVPFRFGFPVFDIVFLGLGTDGHIASIFPGDEKVLSSVRTCEVAVHPETGQKRITLTLPVINNAERIIFLVSGKDKAEIVAEILNNPDAKHYPAGMVNPHFGKIYWYMDLDAASLLSQYA
ncbi:MAG TPA: 6-phosphogluconolactonase [Bacteroidales bacterium]|nr:6-phosphogluconolactonase [Bacteroidales bacterium]